MFEIKVDCWRYFTLFLKQKRFESFLSSIVGNYLICMHCLEANTCECLEEEEQIYLKIPKGL